jgi:ribosomal protein RSM22 (predicted rRNA methylase)
VPTAGGDRQDREEDDGGLYYVSDNDNNDNDDDGSADGDDDDDEDDGPDDGHHAPWKALLTTSGRCAWRYCELPETVNDVVADLITDSQRTRKTLRRVHESVLTQHAALATAREKERNRLKPSTNGGAVGNKNQSGGPKQKDGSGGGVGGNTASSNSLIVQYGANEAFADVYFRFVPHYLIVRRILEEAASLVGRRDKQHDDDDDAEKDPDGQPSQPPTQRRLRPRRIIDLGIGTSGASMAALDVFGDDIEWIHGIEPSNVMRQAAERILADHPICRPRVTISSHLSITSATSHFDLALFCYTATEFPNNAATIAAAAALWDKLAMNGLFVMVEPGTPDGFRSIRTVRSMLLDCANDDESYFDIIAPCTHNGQCPMEKFQLNSRVYKKIKTPPNKPSGGGKNNKKHGNAKVEPENGGDGDYELAGRTGFCSFVQTMPLGDKKEKFSYLVARKTPRRHREKEHGHNNSSLNNNQNNGYDEFDGAKVADLLQQSLSMIRSEHTTEESATAIAAQVLDLRQRYLNSTADEEIGLELVRTDRGGFGRIVHAPSKKKGHILIDACVAPGAMVRFKIRKSHDQPHQVPGVYAAAKKSRWGGFWPYVPHLVE